MSYAEPAITTNFTFLTGASHPEEMVGCAAGLRLAALPAAAWRFCVRSARAFRRAYDPQPGMISRVKSYLTH